MRSSWSGQTVWRCDPVAMLGAGAAASTASYAPRLLQQEGEATDRGENDRKPVGGLFTATALATLGTKALTGRLLRSGVASLAQ